MHPRYEMVQGHHAALSVGIRWHRRRYRSAPLTVDWRGLGGQSQAVWMMRNLLLAALVLIATSAKAAPPIPPGLARTTWRWVSLTTPDETLTIAEPERYTLRFSDGDRVALRADCNRGAGSVAFPEPGAIRFGALAITRAMCPTGSLGARFAQEVVRAVRWAIQRGELRLELSGDAGVLHFTRQS